MADCSAAGTTIDRAARAVFGSGNQDTTKHVSALLGHAAMVAGNQRVTAMPLSAPDHLILPGSYIPIHAPVSEDRTMTSLSHLHSPSMTHPGVHPLQQHQQLHQQLRMMHPQYQAMAQQAMFQQQQQIMQQQMQIMVAQQQQQIQQQQQQKQQQTQPLNSKAIHEPSIYDNIEQWHEGLEEEALAYSDVEEEIRGHDGVVNGASIEELAAAWAQAEAEYEKMAEQQHEHHDDDYANLFQESDSLHRHTQPYEFINKIQEGETVDKNWMNEGMQHFRNGDIQDAIRSFEMELQHNNPDNATAWRMLGRCHAENDMDPEAIKCLEAAVDRDPYSPESLLALGVSYVNELDHDRALENMKAWFTHNPKYAGMELPNDIYAAVDATNNRSAFEEVKQLLLSALAFDATDAGDVHEALGVIYNVIKDYDAAADSLRKALESRPEDYQLWNKLGATLANGSRSDQALPAYHRALQLKPKYARAWLNMAISHSNLQDHDEAARCYLQTLSLNPGAKHCWTYLRMALSCAERWDLLPLCFSHDLAAFREHFDFIYEEQ